MAVANEEVDANDKQAEEKTPNGKLLKVPVRVRTVDGQEDEFPDYVMEIDKDRVYIKTDDPYKAGTVLNIAMELPGLDRPILFRGEVVRINPHQPSTPEGLDPGMGVVLDRVSFDNRRLIGAYLDQVQSDDRSQEYSRFLTWVRKISRPLDNKEREKIKKDLLKVLYGASREGSEAEKRRKNRQELEILAHIPLFEEMNEYELDELGRIMAKEDLRAGNAVFDEGDVGDKMYAIIKGAVDIIKMGEKGPGQILVTLKKGDYFGEMSLIDDAPRSASAMASEDSVLLSINKNDLALLFDNNPGIAAKIYKFFVITLNQRLRETNEKIKSFVNMAQEMSQS